MILGKRVVVVMPAYNAALTLARTVRDLDSSVVDGIVLVDDASTDGTFDMARSLGLITDRHPANRGYGGNQKTCYARALAEGADVVVMVHPDYQYSPALVPAMASMIACGEYDLVLGSRVLAQKAIARGMPWWKYVANRGLTLVENLIVANKLSEYHTGLRAFSRELLECLHLDENSDDFVFDNQVIVQTMAAGGRIGELSCPTRYAGDSSSINFRRSVRYGFGVVRTALQYRMHRLGLRSHPYLEVGQLSGADSSQPVRLPRAS